jgi:hypothetical protein
VFISFPTKEAVNSCFLQIMAVPQLIVDPTSINMLKHYQIVELGSSNQVINVIIPKKINKGICFAGLKKRAMSCYC